MKYRRQQGRHRLSYPCPTTRFGLLAMALCSAMIAGCTSQWRSVDLRRPGTESEPAGVVKAEGELGELEPLLFPDDKKFEEDATETAADLSSDPDAGSVEAAGASLPYDEDPTAAWSLSPETSDLALEETFSAEQVLEYAARHNPLLRVRHSEVEVARAKLVTAGLLPNPELILRTDTPIHDDNPTSLISRVMWSVPLGGRIGHEKAVARTAMHRAQLAVEQEAENVLQNVAELALHVLYLQELVEEYRTLERDFQDEIEIQRSISVDTGQVGFADVFETFLDASGYELAHRQARRELTAARLELCLAMGMRTPVSIRIEGGLSVQPVARVSLETVMAAALEADPEFVASRLAILESQHELALAHSESKPDLVIGPRYDAALGNPNDSIGGRIDVELPFFDRNQGAISESAAQIEVNRALSDVAKVNSLNNVASTYSELMHVQDSLDQNESFLSELKQYGIGTTRAEMETQAVDANQIPDLLRKISVMKVKGLNLRYQHNLLRTRLEFALDRKLQDLVVSPVEVIPIGKVQVP